MSKAIRLAGAILLFCGSAFAQFETAEVLGTIHDPTVSTIRSASVTLTSESTGVERKTTSDDSGLYDFFNVPPGQYTISAELSGFQTFETTNVVVDVNARQRVDITMARLEHRFGGGLYFLNSFTWSNAMGTSQQALEYFAGYYAANPQRLLLQLRT